jgi:methionine-rich copper-binding protein CopC
MKKLRPLLVVALMILAGSVANAHPLPKTATPKPNAVLTTSPAEIRIGFSEGLVAAFSGLEVDDQGGTAAETGEATVNPQDDKELVVPIRAKLAPGTYTVKWHAVGTDTHHVSGHYSFQVKP